MDGVDGKIIFKVRLDNEIKKVIIHNDEINYNELLLMIQRIFSDRIKPNDEFKLKYADDENDLITLANDSDVAVAIQTTKILKLTIYLDGKEEKVEEIKASDIVNELRHLRTSVDSFLNKFERFLKLDSASAVGTGAQKTAISKAEESSRQTNTLVHEVKTSNSSAIILNDIQKEFDPLAKKGELDAQKFQPVQKNSRAETPDSIGSSEFSLSHKSQTLTTIPVTGAASSNDVTSSTNAHFGQDFHHHHHHHQQFQQQQQFANQVPAAAVSSTAPTVAHPQQYNPPVATANSAHQQQQPTPSQMPQPQYSMQQPQAKYQHAQTSNMMPPQPPQPQQQQPQPQHPPYYQQQQQTQQQTQQQAPQQAQVQQPPPQQVYQPQAQPQQFYNSAQPQQQQQQPPPPQIGAYLPPSQQHPQYGQPMPPQPAVANNPYSNKINPNASLARPPSTSLYQQGYK